MKRPQSSGENWGHLGESTTRNAGPRCSANASEWNGTMLAAYSTADEIKGSPCPKCRVPMMLGRVMPEPPDFDLYTYLCPECEYVKCVAVETSTMQAH
jgi:hypothetical protein